MKIFIFGLALLTTMFVGCHTEPINKPSIVGSAAFEASTEVFVPQTKTSMTSDKKVVWSLDDRLAIFQGCTVADEFLVTGSSAGKTNASFNIVRDNSDVNGSFSAGTEVPSNVAIYPYADGLSLSASSIDGGTSYEIEGIVLPVVQNYVAGSFGNGAFPMVAVTETMSDHTLRFKNVLGAMKLQFKGTQTVVSIKVEGKNGEKLSGPAIVTAYANGLTPVITMTDTDDSAKSVILDCGGGVQLSESTATEFIIALPPVLFSQGFTVTITDTASQNYTIETAKTNNVLRSSLLVMPAFMLGETQGDDSGEGFVEEINLKRTSLTMAPGTSYTFEYGVISTNVIDPTLTWSSSNSDVAIVDQCGKVTAVADGTATITAIALGGANATCSVTVKSATAIADRKYVVGDADYGYGIVIGDVVWAPVNCGYEPATADYKGYPYGKLYQWGRKHGQGDDFWDASYPSGKNLVAGPVMPSEGQSDQNADVFFTVSASPYDWCKVQNDAHWNSETEDAPVKTDTDPCPTGWRVPTYKELRNLTKNPSRNSSWATNDVGQNGRYFSGEYSCIDGAPKVFFPAASHRQDDGRAGDSRGYRGCYWSSRPYSNLAYGLTFADGYCGIGGYSRACGYSVRCVQE